MLLDPGLSLTLRPMRYPQFYERYRAARKNIWNVDEIDFQSDVQDLRGKMTPAEQHLIHRLVAFFATGDTIVSNNLALNLYKHLNAPEARLYLSQQIAEEALHVQFYLTLLDTYVPDPEERAKAFAAVENIPSIRRKAEFCLKHTEAMTRVDSLRTVEDRRAFLLNLYAYAAATEGLFFFGAFAYVYFLRSRGLLSGLASGTNWVFRDECVVEGTEVLTPNGWKKIEDLTDADEVAQFDMITSEVSFVVPSRRVKNRVNEKIVVFSSEKGGIHQAITAGHNVVQKWEYQEAYSKQIASEFKPNGKKMIPVSGYKKTGREHLSNIERFMIALQADGSLPSARYTGERCGALPVHFSLKRERKIHRLRDILRSCNFEWTEYPEGEDKTAFRVKVPSNAVKLTKQFKDWVVFADVSSTWASEFIEELQHWDGHVPAKEENGSYIYYSSVVENNVDVVQTLAAFCGRHVSRSVQTKKREDGSDYDPQYRAWIHNVDFVRGGRNIHRQELEYVGNVHCVTVPTGAFLIRSNGKVSVTGNCGHMEFAFEAAKVLRAEEPALVDAGFEHELRSMIEEAVECESLFADDLLSGGIIGLSTSDMKQYLRFVADQRLSQMGLTPQYGVKNPFAFMDLQDVQEHTNFFERRVSAYQVGIEGSVGFDEDF